MHQTVNFYISALVITVVGAVATLLIVRTNADADTSAYAGAQNVSASKKGEIPLLKDELKRR